MNLKEHLQFLTMMIPTLLLLGAAILTLALPTSSSGEMAPIAQNQPEGGETGAYGADFVTIITFSTPNALAN